jgi:hypothetical protein
MSLGSQCGSNFDSCCKLRRPYITNWSSRPAAPLWTVTGEKPARFTASCRIIEEARNKNVSSIFHLGDMRLRPAYQKSGSWTDDFFIWSDERTQRKLQPPVSLYILLSFSVNITQYVKNTRNKIHFRVLVKGRERWKMERKMAQRDKM